MGKGEANLKAISDLFARHRNNLVAPEASVINAFVEVVGDLLNIKLKKNMVRYQPSSRTLYLTKNGPIKSEIQLRRDDILNHLKGRLGPKNAPKTIL